MAANSVPPGMLLAFSVLLAAGAWLLMKSRGPHPSKKMKSPGTSPPKNKKRKPKPSVPRRTTSTINHESAAGRIESARRNPFGGQAYEDLALECASIDAPRSWQDPLFPHSNESLFIGGVEPKDWLRDGERGEVLKNVHLSWEGPWVICGTRRPLGTNSRGEASWLFHRLDGEECGLDAHDVQQGSLGDCYFLSALALVATDTCCADGLVDDELDAAGCYGVSFWVDGAWQMVYVDGFFPCYTPNNVHASVRPTPVFAKSANRREIWPMVVEKAFAKLRGTYQAVGGGGRVATALQALTGGSATAIPTSVGADRLWKGLCDAVEDPSILVGAGTRSDATEEERCGIIDGHAYAVLHAVEVSGHRLLLLRNPWGHGEWKGPWSDGSKEWSSNPDCRAAAGNFNSDEDDGDFWMSVDDFCSVFATVDMCRLPGDHHRRTQNAELQPMKERKEEGAKQLLGNENIKPQLDEWLVGTAAESPPASPSRGSGKKHRKNRK